MTTQGLFITGTDTGCGKTEITLALMHGYRGMGQTVLGMKPVASGSEETPDGLRNGDAVRIRAAASREVPYERVNPYPLAPAIAPHIAAAEAGVAIDGQRIVSGFRELGDQAELVIVEGVGGWRVPLGPDLEVADLPLLLELPTLLVVGLRLGCLNHALLSAESIAAAGCRLAGWVANEVEPGMSRVEENIAALERAIPAPLVGRVPYIEGVGPQAVVAHLDLRAPWVG